MSKKESIRVNKTKEFEKRRKKLNKLAMLGYPIGMRTAFEMEWHKNFFLQDTRLSGEPTLEDEITINGEQWEIWQGVFVGRGSFGGTHFVLILQRVCIQEECSLWGVRHYSWNTLGSSYPDWKWFLETSKRDTVEAFFTRYVNEQEHEGVLSEVDYEKAQGNEQTRRGKKSRLGIGG